MYHYAAINSFADEYSVGFENTWSVIAFHTKRDRDNYVAAAKDLATRAVPYHEVTQYVSRKPKPWTGEYYAIVAPYLEEPGTMAGFVEVADNYNPMVICRFYNRNRG